MCDRQLGVCMGKFALWPCCFRRRCTAKIIQHLLASTPKKIGTYLTAGGHEFESLLQSYVRWKFRLPLHLGLKLFQPPLHPTCQVGCPRREWTEASILVLTCHPQGERKPKKAFTNFLRAFSSTIAPFECVERKSSFKTSMWSKTFKGNFYRKILLSQNQHHSKKIHYPRVIVMLYGRLLVLPLFVPETWAVEKLICWMWWIIWNSSSCCQKQVGGDLWGKMMGLCLKKLHYYSVGQCRARNDDDEPIRYYSIYIFCFRRGQ